MLTASMVPDFSGDFDASFGAASQAYGGIVSIEAGTGLDRDSAGAAEATAAARADPTMPMEALSSMPADADLALANSASMRTDFLLAREFAASHQIRLPLRGEWLVAQRSENAAPAESLLRALADAVVRGEGAALLFLDPVMPTEQNPAAAALLLLAPAESGALLPSDAILPGESGSGAALKVDALLPIEASGSTRADGPVGGELFASLLIGDFPLVAEALAAVAGDAGALLELLPSLRIDPGPPIETAGAAFLKTDAALSVEILGVSPYLVRVTFTLSDGRVITFATTAMPIVVT